MSSLPGPLWNWLTGARWFAGKGRSPQPGTLRALDWFVHDDQLSIRTEIAEVDFADGSRELYQLPLAYRPAGAEAPALFEVDADSAPTGPGGQPLTQVSDALTDAEALTRLVPVLAAAANTPTWTAVIVRPADLTGELRTFGGEQSNTSVMIGTRAMAKFFRRLEPGANLDIAVHDALGRSGVTSVASLYGWLTTATDQGDQIDLAMIVQQLPQARDGWELATAAAKAGTDFSADAAELGTALARIHQALKDTFPSTTLSGSALARGMRDRLTSARREAPALDELAEPLEAIFDQVGDKPLPGQRIHGDFHLGQTLHTADGWRIIDFEGEPIKTLAERSEPDSVWRDVAGMLRSFAYATSACEDPHSDQAQQWYQATSQAFLQAYQRVTGQSRMNEEALRAYITDKAVYEVVYETRNRPTWVDIPLGALRSLTSA